MEHRAGAEAWVPRTSGLGPLRTAAADCRGCELWADATQVVFSAGTARASIVLVGEQPGDGEDRAGEPFVGPAGRVLDEALEAAGVARSRVYLTNAVKHFRHTQRGKRRIHEKPALGHITACRPWLAAELSVVRPDVIVCLGATAARAVLGRSVTISAERGSLLDAASDLAPRAGVLVTTHPSALLRMRGRGDWDEAFGLLVRDLAAAAATAGGQ